MIKFINLQVNDRLGNNCCAFPRLEGFNKLKRDKTQTNKNYYEQDSYYVPIHITIKWN